MYFTDRGIEELETRRGDDEVTLAWLADQLRAFVDLNPEFEVPVERLATWLARLDDDRRLTRPITDHWGSHYRIGGENSPINRSWLDQG